MERMGLRAKYSTVYMATNSVNGKRYIGVTCEYLSQRKSAHFRNARNGMQTAFARAIRKYGQEAFVFSVLQKYETFDAAKEGEIKYIAELKPEYNMTRGGDGSVGYRHTEEARRKVSEANKGRPGYWKGKKIPREFVKPFTEERKRKIGNKHRGRKMPLEVAASFRGKRHGQSDFRGIVCLNDGIVFPTAAAAASHYGIDNSVISAMCHRRPKPKSAKGRVFRFYGDHEGGLEEVAAVIAEAKRSQRRGLGPNYRKPVVRLPGEVHFETVKGAAEASGLSQETVIRSLKKRNRRGSFSGWSFVYLDEWKKVKENASSSEKRICKSDASRSVGDFGSHGIYS